MPQYPTALLEQIKQLVPISRLVGEYVQADKAKSQPGDLWACCVFHNERTPSFHAEDAKGIYHCFGCGATGDQFQWMQEHQGMTFTQAVEAVADMAGVSLPGKRSEPSAAKPRARYEAPVMADPYEGYEFIPVPADTAPIVPGQKTPPLRNPKRVGTDKLTTHYKPSAVYAYFNAAGELLGYVLLVPFKDGKSTPGIWWARGPDGFEGWCHGSLENAPLYGLPELLANPDKQVLVVEGEKCRREADKALQGRVVVVSWCGGTNRVDRTDWSPLAGRSVIWWADDDAEGSVAMFGGIVGKPGYEKWQDGAIQFAKARTNKRVTEYRAQEAGEYKKGGDVADLIADGGSVADYIKANISEWADEHILEGINSRTSVRGSVEQPSQHQQERSDTPSGTSRNSPERTLNEPHTNDPAAPKPRPQPSPAPENNSPPTQSLGGVSREAVVEEVDNPDWQDLLQYTKDGGGLDKSSLVNPGLMLQYHDMFRNIYAWNAFANEAFLMRQPPWDRKWKKPRLIKNTDITSTAAQMEFVGLKPKRNDMNAVIAQVAEYNSYNPVVDALEKLVWDGLPRLQGGKAASRTFAPFAVRYLGADNIPINQAFAVRTLVGAVARAFQPGCKNDTMWILEGDQGAGKSTAIKVLADGLAPDLFTDEMSDPGSKDAGLQMQGKWIIEVSELASFRKSDIDTLKGWLSRSTDRFRRPYGSFTEEFPRSCIMVGTVNPPPSGYMKDPTGNRRFWPTRCGEIDLAILREDAPQIWAEALHLYRQGVTWHLSQEESDLAVIAQQARYEHDPWATMIDDYLARIDGMKTTVSVLELMGTGCINIHNERRTPAHSARIEAHLSMIGWKRIDKGQYRKPGA